MTFYAFLNYTSNLLIFKDIYFWNKIWMETYITMNVKETAGSSFQ